MDRKKHLLQQLRSSIKRAPSQHAGDVPAHSPLRCSLRTMAFTTLLLLFSSQLLLLSVWNSGRTKKLNVLLRTAEPLVTHWRVRPENSANTKVLLRASETADAVGFLSPGTRVRTYPYSELSDDKYLFMMSPINGFALKRLFEMVPEGDEFDLSPFLYEGYRWEGHNLKTRFLFAPTALVIAQQLWNALQIFEVFLAIALFYVVRSNTATSSDGCSWLTITRTCEHYFVGLGGALGLMILLPFSIYVSSPGAPVLAIVTLMTCLLALSSQNAKAILLDVGPGECTQVKATQGRWSCRKLLLSTSLLQQEHLFSLVPSHDSDEVKGAVCSSSVSVRSEENSMEQTLPSRPVMQIELLGFLCNLSSSLYNYHHSHKTWPHWRYHFFNLDKFFGWIGGNHRAKIDMFNTRVYTLGLPNVHVPLYVPGGLGSTTGGHMFWILWSFIPVLYVAYYLCMYLLAPRSPGVKIQRAMLLFSMFHFLFLTGKRDTVLFSRMFSSQRAPLASLTYLIARIVGRLGFL